MATGAPNPMDSNNNMGGGNMGGLGASTEPPAGGGDTPVKPPKKKGLKKKLSKLVPLATSSGKDKRADSVGRRGESGGEEKGATPPGGMQPLEGLLSKYTNVMKGWQYRWFVLDPECGRLEYHEREEYKKQKPRGWLYLAGAVICPSDEDSQTFTVNAANSEVYRLRAIDAKERQHWVNRLRATAEYHTEFMGAHAPPGAGGTANSNSQNSLSAAPSGASSSTSGGAPPRPHTAPAPRPASLTSLPPGAPGGPGSGGSGSADNVLAASSGNNGPDATTSAGNAGYSNRSHHKGSAPPAAPPASGASSRDEFADVKEMLAQVQSTQNQLVASIQDLPVDGSSLGPLDKEMLLLKATSSATLSCLEQCLHILQQQQVPLINTTTHNSSLGATIEWLDPRNITNGSLPPPVAPATGPVSPTGSFVSVASIPGAGQSSGQASGQASGQPGEPPAPINHDEEVEDEEEYTDTDLEGMEEHKSVILHLLSQLKLGMDLTKVVLPTFILEKRSLLEMFADCMAHPDLFLRIPSLPSPEARMLGVVEWYLTSFHASRRGAFAKKPYNPIIGETFRCSWQPTHSPNVAHSSVSVGTRPVEPPGGESGNPAASSTVTTGAEEDGGLYYCAEQVSHHPPVSAFYFECPAKQLCMNASIYTKSKFMGMSIGVQMVGKVRLSLLGVGEDYEFSLPSAYARSILTVPWVELGDKISVTCRQTGLSASVVFHTKPFYGGKLHRVTCEVKRPTGEVYSRVTGEWNGQLEFTDTENGSVKVVDTASLATLRKRVRRPERQGQYESRRLWRDVTRALRDGDIDSATEHKRFLEERQRQGERLRKETKTPYPTKFFHLENGVWTYNHTLKPGQKNTSL